MKNIGLHIMDIVQNSITAGASEVIIDIHDRPSIDLYQVRIKDNGCGMDKELLDRVTDPFTTTRKTRKVGLGLSLFRQNAEQSGGLLAITATPGAGCEVTATFQWHHIDRPAQGDIPGIMRLLITANPDLHFIYRHTTDKGHYQLDTEDVKINLDGISIAAPEITRFLKEMITECLMQIETA
jgi:hypothetical protein